MYNRQRWINVSVSTLALALAACGGGDDGSSSGQPAAATPPPAPPPAPPAPPPAPPPPPITGATDPIIFAASGSQNFAAEGRYLRSDGGIGVSLDGPSGTYLVTTPADTTPQPLQRASNYLPQAGSPWTNFALPAGGYFLIRASGSLSDPLRYLYSNLAAWGYTNNSQISGMTAFGIPTLGGALPQQGMVTYTGFLEGTTSEQFIYQGDWCCDPYFGGIQGQVSLTFDFAAGTATITVTPSLELAETYPLPATVDASLVWSRSTNGFFLPVPGNPQSLDFPISGLFTGPGGEELIGGLRIEYVSPIDGSRRLAGGAFIAKRTG